MRMIATDNGRVLQLIVMDEIRPPSGIYMPDLYHKIAERYEFVGYPQNIAEAIVNGAKFQHGRIVTSNKTIVISEMGIFNDGIIVDASNTDDAEYVLDDVMVWATTTFALRERRTIIPKRFTSLVTIEFEKPIESVLKGLIKIFKLAEAAYKRTYEESININLLRFAMNSDPLYVPQFRNTQFYIERRIQRPYTENRYQSGAPLRTEDHITLLSSIERVLLAGNAD